MKLILRNIPQNQKIVKQNLSFFLKKIAKNVKKSLNLSKFANFCGMSTLIERVKRNGFVPHSLLPGA